MLATWHARGATEGESYSTCDPQNIDASCASPIVFASTCRMLGQNSHRRGLWFPKGHNERRPSLARPRPGSRAPPNCVVLLWGSGQVSPRLTLKALLSCATAVMFMDASKARKLTWASRWSLCCPVLQLWCLTEFIKARKLTWASRWSPFFPVLQLWCLTDASKAGKFIS